MPGLQTWLARTGPGWTPRNPRAGASAPATKGSAAPPTDTRIRLMTDVPPAEGSIHHAKNAGERPDLPRGEFSSTRGRFLAVEKPARWGVATHETEARPSTLVSDRGARSVCEPGVMAAEVRDASRRHT